MEGYQLSRLDQLHMGGGGICVYTRNNLKAKVLKDLLSISERNFHKLWISLLWKKTNSIVVCTTYRPDDCPLSAFEDTLKPTYMQALMLNKPIVILGDLNCDLRKACMESRALNNFSSEINLQQLIKNPTRITVTTKSLLNVILISCPQSVHSSGVINYYISDHLPVFVELKVKAPKPLPLYINFWCCENQLLMNPDKTKFMLIATRQLRKRFSSSPVVSFLDKSLEPVASAKDLGVILDSHTYDCHTCISNVVSPCMAKLCQIKRVKTSFDGKTLEQLVSLLAFSKMLYCSIVWSNTSTTNIKKLQPVQNFACKVVIETRKFDHVTPLLHELNWLSADQLLFFRATVMTYKCMNHLTPSYLSSKFVKRSDIHNCRTRNREALQIPFFRSASGQQSFPFRGARLWNNISPELRQCASLKAFKEKLKSHILANSY